MGKRNTFMFPAGALLAFFLLLPAHALAEECTTVVVSGSATVDGRPLLWKNRDWSDRDNKLAYLADGPVAAVAIVKPGNSASAYMGVNEKGFAIEQSDSSDLEGTSAAANARFLRYALLHCSTLTEFEMLLARTNGPGRETKGNYGVIDATGAAAMFELGNHTFRKYDTANPEDAPNGFIVRTNFAFSGNGTGTGQARYERASELIKKAAFSRTLSHGFLLRVVARDLKNDVIDPYPLPFARGQDGRPVGYIRTFNSISRFRTVSCVVFHGVLPGEDPQLTTMWTILGEPVCGIALPTWLLAGSVPPELGGPASAPLNDMIGVKKASCYPLASSPEYLYTAALDDGHGGGAFSYTFPIENRALARAATLRAEWRASLPTPQAVAAAQNKITREANECFLASSVPKDGLSSPLKLICRTLER